MQHPTPTYGSIALPEYLSTHGTTIRTDPPADMTVPLHTDHTRETWLTSDRAHDIELRRQYHRIAHIIRQRFQSNPDEGGRRTAKRILSDGYSGLSHNSNTHHNVYKRIPRVANPNKNVTRDTYHCALAHLVMESVRKALGITMSLTANNDARRAFQPMLTLDSERFRTLVHSYRRPTLTRSVSDPSIVTTNTLKHASTETPIQHNNNSSPLRRFATMPPPSTTGRTPLTPNPNAVAIESLPRTLNPISATNLFPDETPDTDRCNTTETAHFKDIDEDNPSHLDDDLIPQINHEIPTNTMEFHRESPDPSSPHDHDDEPPSMDNDDLVQTQHATPPQPNDPSPPHDNDDVPPSMDNDELVYGAGMSLAAASVIAPPVSIHGAAMISATIIPPAADGATTTNASATDADMAVDTGIDTAASVDGRTRKIASIDRPADDGHAVTASGARAAVIPSPKKRRSSCGPAHEARRKAFYASKEPRTTSAPSTQVGAGTKGVAGRGV